MTITIAGLAATVAKYVVEAKLAVTLASVDHIIAIREEGAPVMPVN